MKLNLDTNTLLLVLAVLVGLYTVLMIIWLIRMKKIYERYDIFMRGRDAETLEDLIAELMDKVESLEGQDLANKDVIRIVNRQLVNSYQKTGLVKYNAFDGMGGQASFALALLDLNNNGFIVNVIHSRSSCYTYLKEVQNGSAEVVLSTEEKQALTQALKKKERFFNPDEESV